MVSEQVRFQIEAFSQRMLNDNPLLERARQGLIGPRVVHAYLRSLHYLLSCTVPNLMRARDRAVAQGTLELGAYFEQKLLEERGHDAWAESDMRRLAECFGTVGSTEPVPSALALMRFNEELIDEDPRLYVVYILCAEYFTVLIGPAWVAALTSNCGVPAAALTSVTNHVESDAAHAQAGFEAVEHLLAGAPLQQRLPELLETIFDFMAQLPKDLLALCQTRSVDEGPCTALHLTAV